VRQEAWTNDFRVETESRDDMDGHVIMLFSCNSNYCSDYTSSSEKHPVFILSWRLYTLHKCEKLWI